ncbi:MAG: stalk domain-containing protein [Armatimonadota bacterium]
MRRVLLCCVALAGCAGLALANDGYVEGVGGTIELMDEHTDIELVSELVLVDIGDGAPRVYCLFVFKNTSDRLLKVNMGFPEYSFNAGSPEDGGFSSFESWVDGVPTPTRIEGLDEHDKPHDWSRWRVKTVTFGPKQLRIVENRYTGGLGGTTAGDSSFRYSLGTGRSWKGPIGHALVIVRFHNMAGTSLDVNQNGHVPPLIREWTNFEPEPGEAVHVSFFPACREVWVDDRQVYSLGDTPGVRVDQRRRLVAPLRTFAEWVGAEVSWDAPARTAHLLFKDHDFALTLGSRKIKVDGEPRPFGFEPEIESNAITIPVWTLAHALGLRMSGEFAKPVINTTSWRLPSWP